MKTLPRRFYACESVELAPQLLNKVLWWRQPSGVLAGRIVEVEAYAGEIDEASHAFRGQTKRTRSMFGPPGHLYMYFTYGMHWCANVVCGREGQGRAVLIRALEPLRGVEVMRARRAGGDEARLATLRERDLCSGPARLCQAFGIDRELDGVDLVRADVGLSLRDSGTPPPESPGVGPRVGISKAVEKPWRFWVEGNPHVSRGRPGPSQKARTRSTNRQS